VTLSPADGDGAANEMAYASWQEKAPAQRTKDEVRALLVESGMWTALRTRPWSRIPAVDSHGAALFVTAMDSNPLAPKAEAVIARHKEFFETGLAVLEKLMDGRPVHCCRAAGAKLPDLDWGAAVLHDFAGPHPSGTAGLHIHTILPVSRARMVWHIGYPDVIAIGHLFATGRLFVERVISVAGPAAKTPGLVATRMGAAVDSLVAQTKCDGDICTISGSVFNGREAAGSVDGYLGRYHNQVTLLPNDRSRRLLGWMTPGFNVFSVTRLFASTFLPTKKFALSTDRFGGYRTMVPFSSYDKVMAFDLMAPFLLRALLAGDLETAEQLGALELDEEDLALCTFVCPSKNEYGPVLRDVLTRMEKEG